MWNQLNSQEQQDYQIIKPSESEFARYHLLHTVKQVNGQIAFKQISEAAFIIKFNARTAFPRQYNIDNFGYILQGEIYVYKLSNNQNNESQDQSRTNNFRQLNEKIFITNHKSHQIFGLQEYPLYWSESLHFQASQGARILVLPLELSLFSFRKIFNFSMVQQRAELIKRCEQFKAIDIQRIKKIGLHSQRVQAAKGQVLNKKGNSLEHLLIVISGQILMTEEENNRLFRKNDLVGLAGKINKYNAPFQFMLSCMTDCELLVIPKIKAVSTFKLNYRLGLKDSGHLISRRTTEYQRQQKQKQRQKEDSQMEKSAKPLKAAFFSNQNYLKKSCDSRLRPRTSSYRKASSNKQFRSSTFYNIKNSSNQQRGHLKTENDDSSPNFLSQPLEPNQSEAYNEYVSMGEIWLRKFLNRKQRRENCQIIKYLRSNAPQLKLNPMRQYGVVKPLHVGSSNYVKNMKRKMKRSCAKNTKNTGDEQKKEKSRFSFFFKEDTD